MGMIRCPNCGERYSDTYRECPFCEEEEALRDGEEIRRSPRRGRRAAHGRQYNIITPMLIVLIIIMAALLVYLLYGDKLAEKFSGEKDTENPPIEEVTPGIPVQDDTQQEDTEQDSESSGEQSGIMPEDTSEPTQQDTPPVEETDDGVNTDYEQAAKLPNGLSLSTEDFSLMSLGETHTIQASGGSSTYKWISQDEGIASVDQNGKVTAVSGGTTNVLVTDGSKKAICIVRVRATGSLVTTPSGSDSSTGLRAGAATVVNGGNGVRVRSGPGTDYEILATVPNGADVQIVENAGNGWYKITFSDVGGATTPGYMKGDFLSNQ